MSDLGSELLAYLRDNAPDTFNTSGWAFEPLRWVLTKDTVRGIYREQGDEIRDDYDWNATGYLFGLPYRVDDSATKPYALERAHSLTL